ncbi:maleylpyruvate isomerase family mycothiol-dependent enzyme [Nocardioides sp. IC4_145]|uniref:maleylpyruvate isomerase family mycothiol-dependent enzyme n=1 Tax=Nocardioides sp. IC4_145 TaxID=2714037 RepID=UPI00140908BF|nr:maleylpyruvate isomerase family mycothiol-dependent enzyme [Nocardioides sp. IC4_145]NHC22246.1 maleylpyruvate isomerase family mycothiol-dependent enzyme [Nocardioides sp. IC4_145]
MDLFEEIADERRALADLLTGLAPEAQATPSLCAEWDVHAVVGHLVVPLEVGLAKFALAMVRSRGSFDRANARLAREWAQRPFEELLGVLRERAESRFTPPGMGPEAPLTDLLVHGLDVRWPLGIEREVPAGRLRATLDFVAGAPGGIVPPGSLDGLRFEADDLDWAAGDGPTVSGRAEALLLGLTGRSAALGHLDGDGLATLRGRLSAARS